MPRIYRLILLLGMLGWSLPLAAQQVCPGFPVVVNTPEDELMLAVNGAETPQEQIAALDKFSQEHADSRFMPCVHEYYSMAYLKLNEYDKAIEHAEQGLAGEYRDMMLMLNLAKAYVASGRVGDSVFEVILKAPEQIQAESTPNRPGNVSDEEWQKTLEEAAQQGKEWDAYMEYAFFQLLQRVTDASKRIQWLDRFVQAYPNSPNTAQINFNYFLAYKMANDAAKAGDYGEKAIAADPENVITLNLVADDYASRQTNLDKATEYAKKALTLAGGMKKPEGFTDQQFKAYADTQLGLAHLTLGYVAFLGAAKTKKVAPAIEELKAAADLLDSNPELQGKALYLLGSAYEFQYPPNHKLAIDALTRAANLPSGFSSAAQDLLAKVRAAAKQ
jgi:tetratricopeptide (TPR) repeat protein